MSSDFGMDPGFPSSRGAGRRGRRLTGRLVFGALLVTLGLLWTLGNLGLVDADQALRWWPALLIGYGFVRLTGLDGTRRVVSGALFMLAGGWMLARELDIVTVSIFRLWPVFMIVIGASLVWRSLRGPGASGDSTDRSAYPRPFAFMGAVTRTIDSQSLVGLEATAVMGGVEVDLRGARARDSEVVVEAFAWWGGIELIVPPDWRVVSEVVPIMGGVEDSTHMTADTVATTLVIRGLAVMGGMEVRNDKGADRFRGVRVGVHSRGAGGRRKEVRVDASGVTITREDVPPPQS